MLNLIRLNQKYLNVNAIQDIELVNANDKYMKHNFFVAICVHNERYRITNDMPEKEAFAFMDNLAKSLATKFPTRTEDCLLNNITCHDTFTNIYKIDSKTGELDII